MAGSDNEYVRKQGMIGLTKASKEFDEFFNGPVDFVGIDTKNKGEENYEKLIKSLAQIKKQYDAGDINDEAYSAALEDVGTDIAMLDPQYKKGAEQLQESRLSTVKNKIKTLQAQQHAIDLKASPGPPNGGKPSALSQKIKTTMEAYPSLDEQTATGIAAGYITINTNPITGESVLVNKVTGTSKEITAIEESGSQEQPKPRETKTLWELSEDATGVVSGARAGISKVTGQTGLPIAEKTEYARQRTRSAQNNLIRALSINPRYPVAEMNRIKEETNIEPKLLDSPRLLRVRMRAVRDYLKSEIDSNKRTASNKKMPAKQRQDALQSIEAMQSFLMEMGVPEETKGELSKSDQSLLDKYK